MSGITKKQYENIQKMAMGLVASYGIEKLDTVDSSLRTLIVNGFAAQVQAEFGNSSAAARAHIGRAMLRQRHPDWQPPQNWGGAGRGQGRKPKQWHN